MDAIKVSVTAIAPIDGIGSGTGIDAFGFITVPTIAGIVYLSSRAKTVSAV
jgi:hypothetical protein